MNFFRSEEHLRRWDGYEKKLDGGKIGLDSLVQLVGQPYFRNRGGPDYVSHFSEYMEGLVGELEHLPDAGDFFKLSPLLRVAVNLAFTTRIL